MKIKLAAIAKDEAAYLPEWIFHHLSVGFDEIEILVNYTTDNTLDVLKKISDNFPVTYSVVDNSITDETGNFQRSAYKKILSNIDEDIDYLMFLDIDEFWSDSENVYDIKKVIEQYNFPEALAFQWGIKLETNELFDFAYSEVNEYIPSRFVKTIFKVNPSPDDVYVHKVDLQKGNYLFSTGEEFFSKNKAELEDDLFYPGELSRYFVSHRVYRSELEYVSLLGRGRPRNYDDSPAKMTLKNNRFGYKKTSTNSVRLAFPLREKYVVGYYDFINVSKIQVDLDRAKNFVMLRYFNVLSAIRDMPEKEYTLINQVLNGVETEEVLQAVDYFQSKWKSINDIRSLANELRSEALSYEQHDIVLALKMMTMAKKLRPGGPFINKKIEEYESILEGKK
ncbi:glycosyltransferase family 2 protein [Marinomonas sp. GJ51-6]|uniref:glycosyltransferase family 2 protein n=1 Tax=Marinomonas sp. GJ51-6 TaxID=2992802 RepID=UPI0029343945|nr:glycosyltransferase family 2 protein [Marinomonas sp. GJ51-6]WOD06159.1 glycosyltransferase family 2 protein [Marinomonas sp. GJ51-6]